MDLNDAQTHAMLKEARAKAEKLVRELEEKMAEVEAAPPDIPPEQLQQGREAMRNAIASAKRMLQALDDAQQIAATETN